MDVDALYAEYGKLIVQAEIIQNQIAEVKRKIAVVINKPPQATANEDKK